MFLEKIDAPKDLKRLRQKDLKVVCKELRDYVIEVISKNGGHLASNLGVVELTVALHYIFNSPRDKIIWDVGHQSYIHKILTGRREEFKTIRKENGLDGFIKIGNNVHDIFGAGHASTSISAAMGIKEAMKLKEKKGKVIAVIGDGSLTGGMALEAINNAGHKGSDMIIILNDNQMSISENVGALSKALTLSQINPSLFKLGFEWRNFLFNINRNLADKYFNISKKVRRKIKAMLSPTTRGSIFEELGFDYFGPINGHDLPLLLKTLKTVKRMKGPIVVHVSTKKGKGCYYAEQDACTYHGVSAFNPVNGEKCSPPGVKTYSQIFGDKICEMAGEDKKIVAITAAMASGTGLNNFSVKYPQRFFDVGIAEQHAVTFAAGLAREGMKPYFAVYSTFLQRAYDQVIHDVCLQKLQVVFCIDRAGIVGEDGPTHHGVFDISFLRHIPNMTIMAPKDGNELEEMLEFANSFSGPIALRYPKGDAKYKEKISEDDKGKQIKKIEYGKAEFIFFGKDITLIGIGSTVELCCKAAIIMKRNGISATVINSRFIKPLDDAILDNIFKIKKAIIVEEHSRQGGFGASIIEEVNDRDQSRAVKIEVIALPDKFIEHGNSSSIKERYNISVEGILTIAERLMQNKLIIKYDTKTRKEKKIKKR